MRSKTRSFRKFRKPWRIFFPRYFPPSFPFFTIPKTENSEMKTSGFSLRHFDQTLRYFDQTPMFSIFEFSVWGIVQKQNLGVGKNSEFDRNALRLVYIDQNDLDQSIILFTASSSYTI